MIAMLERFTWKEEYSTGIEMIDEQHKDIANALNNLYKTFDTAKFNKKIIDKFIKNLDLYTTTHFDTEEKLMRDYKYREYEEHIKKHAFFKSTYNEILQSKFYSNRPNSPLLALHLAGILSEWLDVHLTTDDKKLYDFLRPKLLLY